jgi:hypothetical protein
MSAVFPLPSSQRPLRVPATSIGTLLLAGAALVATATGLRRLPEASAPREALFVPQARYLRLLSLGYDHLAADVLWFRTISYFGAQYATDRSYPWLAEMCRQVATLDPRAEYVYRFCGLILAWEQNDPQAGIDILAQGVTQLPQSWYLRYLLGFTYFYFLHDDATAARHFRDAAVLRGAHPALARIAARLASREQGPGLALSVIGEILARTENPDMRRSLAARVAALTTDLLNEAQARFRAAHGRPAHSLAELAEAKLIAAVPTHPLGGEYHVDPETGWVSETGPAPTRAG